MSAFFETSRVVADTDVVATAEGAVPSLGPMVRLRCEPVFGRGRRVLGIDPGLTRCGYAVVDGTASGATAAALGVLRTPPEAPLPARLAALLDDIEGLLVEYAPDVVAVEQVFFQVNVRTAMSVGQASGLALATASRRGCEVVQYTPNQVKDAVAGWGAAGKEQVAQMVQRRLGLRSVPRPADAADAAALALCHLAMAPMRASVAQATVAK